MRIADDFDSINKRMKELKAGQAVAAKQTRVNVLACPNYVKGKMGRCASTACIWYETPATGASAPCGFNG